LSTPNAHGYQNINNTVIADMTPKYDASLTLPIFFDLLVKLEDLLPNIVYPYAPGMGMCFAAGIPFDFAICNDLPSLFQDNVSVHDFTL
jgi:hypothetical protein